MSRHILPVIEKINITEESPLWIKSIEKCRQQYASASYEPDRLYDSLVQRSYNYINFGIELKEAIVKKLFKSKGFESFDAFCLKTFRLSGPYCKKIIKAASIAIALINRGFKEVPRCISQAYKLGELVPDKLGKSYDEMMKVVCDNWRQILYAADISKTPITTNFIVKVVDPNSHTPFTYKYSENICNILNDLADFWSWKVESKVDRNQFLSIAIERFYYQIVESSEYQEYKNGDSQNSCSENEDDYYSEKGGQSVSRTELIINTQQEHENNNLQEEKPKEHKSEIYFETRYHQDVRVAGKLKNPRDYLEKLRVNKPELSYDIDEYIKVELGEGDRPP